MLPHLFSLFIFLSLETQVYHGINFEKEIELEERIGSGAFGSVYRGRWQGAPVAVKIMQNVGASGAADVVDSFMQEVKARWA